MFKIPVASFSRMMPDSPASACPHARPGNGSGGVPSGTTNESPAPGAGGAWSLGDSTHWSISRTSVVIAQQFSNLFPGAIRHPLFEADEIRDFVRRDLAAASRHRLEDCSDLIPGDVDSLLQRLSGTTVQEIDHFIAELQALRQRLQHEATRVEREVVQYASLNEAARASMRTISENLSF
jgi:hypothetical protein